jgi:elongation factor 1-gamma
MGQIPALEVRETGFCLSEGTAICQYLACKGPKKEQLLGRTDEEQALIQMWVSLGESEVFPNAYGIIVPMMGRDPYVEWMVKKKEAALMKALDRVELHLKSHKWLVGESGANLADISMASAMFWCFMFIWDEGVRKNHPKTVDWYKRVVEQDEGVKKAFGGILSTTVATVPAGREANHVDRSSIGHRAWGRVTTPQMRINRYRSIV